MRLGLTAGYSGATLSVNLPLVKEAERLGFDSVWTAEAYGSDAITPLCWIGAQHHEDQARHRHHADAGAHAGHGGDDGDEPRSRSRAAASSSASAPRAPRWSKAGTASPTASR